MDKLKKRFNISLYKNYFYYSIYSNALFLNKKLNLLYNFWNKKKEFLLLKSQKNESRIDINYQGFFSLESKFKLNNETIKWDYFVKWSSSYLNVSDLIIRNFFDNWNKNKYLIEPRLLIDYVISDNIFLNHIVNDKKKYFYLFKNKFLSNFFFKLSKKNNLKFKHDIYIYLFDYYYLLNQNYFFSLFCTNWRKNYNVFFFDKMLLYLKLNVIEKIKKYIFFYFSQKKEYMYKNFISLFFTKKYIYFLRNFISNKLNKSFFYFKVYSQYIYYLRKFYKRFHRRFSKLFFNRKNRNSFKTEKKRLWWLYRQKFLSIFSSVIYKNFKKKNYFSFLVRSRKKNNSFILRNFYKFNSLVYGLEISKRRLKRSIYKKKKKKIKQYRISKKLRTFYYIPDPKKTKKNVFRRFKKTVIYKFRKRKKKKMKSIYSGLKFNLFLYNIRNRYRNRMKFLESKKKSTPNYFFFGKKKNNYINTRYNIMSVKHKDLPYYLIKKYKLDAKKDEPDYFYFKKEKYKLRRCFDKIKYKTIKKGRIRRSWRYLYSHRRRKYFKHKFLTYIRDIKRELKFSKKTIRRRKRKFLNFFVKKLDRRLNKKKRNFWFFQKIALYWSNLLRLKKNNSFINSYSINRTFYNLQIVYKNFFLICFKFIKLLFLYNLTELKKKNKRLFFFFNNMLYLYKFYFLMVFKFIKFFNKFYKLKKKNVRGFFFNKFLKKKKKIKEYCILKKRLKALLLKKRRISLKRKLLACNSKRKRKIIRRCIRKLKLSYTFKKKKRKKKEKPLYDYWHNGVFKSYFKKKKKKDLKFVYFGKGKKTWYNYKFFKNRKNEKRQYSSYNNEKGKNLL